MKSLLMVLGVVLTGGTGMAIYLGDKLAKDRRRARQASLVLKLEKEERAARNKLRRDWANEHEVLSSPFFMGNKHASQTIGGITVSCPNCKEL